MSIQVERIIHPSLKYHYVIINNANMEVLAESDYYDYLEILLNALKELHKGFMDITKLVIAKRLVNKEAK